MPRLTVEVRVPRGRGREDERAERWYSHSAASGEDGLFARESVLRKAASESTGLLLGGRCILMQIAHPMVAAGVADHSDFRTDPFGRLQRTLDMTLGIVLGDKAHAMEMLRRFHAIHGAIRGQLSHDAGPYRSGTPYYAHDPALKLWVHATLIDGLLLMHERFLCPLSPEEQESLYDDSKRLARYYGIPESIVPESLEQFHAYMDEMVNGNTLAVTETTRSIARDILYPRNVPALSQTAGPFVRFVTAGLLPPKLRKAYGFRWSSRRQVAMDSLSRAIRLGLPLVPPQVRLMAQAGGGQVIDWAIRSSRRRA